MSKENKKMFKPDVRVISEETMPPGKSTCNGKLQSRDGYCQSPGISEFNRCKRHGGKLALRSLDYFNKSVGLGNAEKLQAMIEDTLSMDNELGSAKIMLLDNLEQYEKANIILNEFLHNQPQRPNVEDSNQIELETFTVAAELHSQIIDAAMDLKEHSFKNAAKMIRILSEGIEKNHKIKMGSKFTLDVKQISSILKIQLEVMRENCKGCPNLKNVIQGLRERTRDIPVYADVSKRNRQVLGERAYGDMIEKVEQIADKFKEHDIEE